MFWKRRKQVVTIGDLSAKGQTIAVECKACGVVSRINPNETAFPAKMELEIASRLLPCPNCGQLNGDGPDLVFLRPDIH